MPRSSPIVRFLDSLLELGWLFILIGVPIFFNLRDYRTFEPDKIVLMRNTVLFMVVVLMIKGLYLAPINFARWFGTQETPPSGKLLDDTRQALRRRPIYIAALVFGFVYILATITSIAPRISFWGSFDRLEGTYTYLTYITLFLILGSHVRTWNQVERIVSVIILASVPVAAYSWLQHFHNDPFVWADGSQTALRTPSTMGNPIFLAAGLLMAVPFTLYRLALGILRMIKMDLQDITGSAQVWGALATVGYAVALCLQLGGIGFSGSRGPALGLLAALVVFGFAVALARHITWLIRVSVAAAVLLALVFGATNTVLKTSSTPGAGFSRFLHLLPSESGTSEVRSLLWKSAPGLVAQHPILGCGPEVLIFCWYPHYPAALRTVELANAAPDRSHDEEIDILLTTGIVGEISYLALLVTAGWTMVRLLRRARSLREVLLASALFGAFIGHIVEGATGIAFSDTLLLLWTIMALPVAFMAGGTAEVATLYASPQDTDALAPSAPLAPVAPPIDQRPAAARTARSAPQSRGSARERNRGGNARQSPQRTAYVPRADRYSFSRALGKLKTGGVALVVLGAIGAVAGTILAVTIFVGNIQVIAADADFRYAIDVETAAGQLVAQQSTYQQGLSYYQISLNAYQNALSTGPSWDWPPPADLYSLYYGKTLLEDAAALLIDKTNPNAKVQTTGAVEQALAVFTAAMQANPLNPDHPRNIAKLYNWWATNLYSPPDIAKLKLAVAFDAKASALAPHNADILDEWAQNDLALGQYDTAHARAWYSDAQTRLLAAEALFPEDGAVYRDLGSVYGQYAVWAEQAGKKTAALSDYKQQVKAWLGALEFGAPGYQKIYPPLANIYALKLHDPCNAALNAHFALQNIANGSLSDPNGSIKTQMEQISQAAAASGKCTAKIP
ncbi:MAG TPA: O-antigen ligase family protein [Chloroflexota bacterium]|jgi:O-antigen ligase